MVRFLLPAERRTGAPGLRRLRRVHAHHARAKPPRGPLLQIRHWALGALLLATSIALAATTGALAAATVTLATPRPSPAGQPRLLADHATRRDAGSAGGQLSERVRRGEPVRDEAPRRQGTAASIAGTASNYGGTAGYIDAPSVALPGALGGRYTGAINGYVTVCADRCARLPIVDWCDCYWGSANQRVVDISYSAWPLITDQPITSGLVRVTLVLGQPATSS